jgi:uncharacterized protein (TIGR03437 family)
MTQLPTVDAVVSANLDPASRTLAPGSLIAIFGRNLAKVGTDLSGWEGQVIPESLNTVAVGAGPHRARLLYVSPTQINAQLPFELAPGTHGLAVSNGNRGRPGGAGLVPRDHGGLSHRRDRALIRLRRPW